MTTDPDPHQVVRALVDAGNRVILDHVLHDAAMAESCWRAFAALDLFRLGVTCPIDVLEARERARAFLVRYPRGTISDFIRQLVGAGAHDAGR